MRLCFDNLDLVRIVKNTAKIRGLTLNEAGSPTLPGGTLTDQKMS